MKRVFFCLSASLIFLSSAAFYQPVVQHQCHALRTSRRSGSALRALEDSQISYFQQLDEGTPTQGARTRELPIFPLNLVACPTGKAPLHIFEMRYRQMMNNIGNNDNMFGIIMFEPSSRQLASVGTVVEVVERRLLPDGRQLNMNVGRERFKLLRITQEKPYMIGLVELDVIDEEPEEGPGAAEIETAEATLWTLLQDVVRLSNKVYDKTKVTLSEDVTTYAPGSSSSSESGAAGRSRRSNFSFAVIEMIDVPPMGKQLMLQTTNILERLNYQVALLDKARRYLAAQATLKDTLN